MDKQYEHDLSEALLRSQIEAPLKPSSAKPSQHQKEKKTMSLSEFHNGTAPSSSSSVPPSALTNEQLLEQMRREAERRAKEAIDLEARAQLYREEMKMWEVGALELIFFVRKHLKGSVFPEQVSATGLLWLPMERRHLRKSGRNRPWLPLPH